LPSGPGIAQHFGARRFAYNWALAQVKANLDARAADPSVSPLAWTLPTPRKAWNQAKAEVAPWWPCCSKEAYACGIATRASPMPAAASTLASTASGRSSPTAMTRSSGWPIPPHGSRRKLAALDRRAAKLRRESVHTLTTVLARHYGTIVVEDLDVAAMARGMSRRAFRRSVYQAGIGQVRPTLAYKTSWAGGQLVVADRWLASSKTHGCGGYHADLRLADRVWVCPACRQLVDRNANAARNLRDWTGPVSDRDVQRGGVAAPVPLVGDHDGQAHAPGVGVRGPVRPPHVAGADDTSTNPRPRGRGTPHRGTIP